MFGELKCKCLLFTPFFSLKRISLGPGERCERRTQPRGAESGREDMREERIIPLTPHPSVVRARAGAAGARGVWCDASYFLFIYGEFSSSCGLVCTSDASRCARARAHAPGPLGPPSPVPRPVHYTAGGRAGRPSDAWWAGGGWRPRARATRVTCAMKDK